MSESYPPDYDSYVPESKLENKSWLMKKAIEYGLNKRSRFVTIHKSSGRLLDIGCAIGLFLHSMQQHPDWELMGIEINPYAANIARDQFGLNVFTGLLEDASYPDDFFDAVTLWDVLEHIHDPSSSLSEIHRILKPDGILVFRIPNEKSWDANIFDQYWAGLDAPRHLYVFDQYTIRDMLNRNGFNITQMSCLGGSYPTFVLSVRFWLLAKGLNESTRQRILGILYHPIIRLLTSPLFFVSSFGLRGPLITVTVRKQN
jgi:SAM-dependent methyltransferase